MPQPTPDDALQIAQLFRGFAQSIEDFRFTHAGDLSVDDMNTLRDRENSLRRMSDDYLDQGVNTALDDVAADTAALGTVTDLLKQDQTKLDNIAKALKVAASLADLASGFATGNPAAIASALQSTVEALKPSTGDKTQAAG